MKKSLKQIIFLLAAVLCMAGFHADTAHANEENSFITIQDDEGAYGTIYGETYGEEADEKWLTVKMEGRGIRLVNSAGEDILLVDQYGGIYVKDMDVDVTRYIRSNVSYGFLYFLIVISLLFNIYNLVKISRRKGIKDGRK